MYADPLSSIFGGHARPPLRRVAIVGSGISGLAAAHTLAGLADITLFEAGAYFGGHTHTIDMTLPDAQGQAVTFGVDTGFLVLNERTYPNLLALFGSSDRLHRVQAGERQDYDYLVDLFSEAQGADHARRFLVVSQIANYGMFLAGWCRAWIEHRHRYCNRPLKLDYYCNMSRSHYASAWKHELAETYGLKPVFAQLTTRFDYYRDGIERMAGATVH